MALSVFAVMAFGGDFEDGVQAYDSGDYKKAVELYQKVAEQGNASAQSNLGVMYYSGQGVKTDKIKTYQYWMMAAKQGVATAQNNLDILCKESPWACK